MERIPHTTGKKDLTVYRDRGLLLDRFAGKSGWKLGCLLYPLALSSTGWYNYGVESTKTTTVSDPIIYWIFGKPNFFALKITDIVFKICHGFIFISLNNQFGEKLVADSDSGHFFKCNSIP